ncbi:MAG: DNA mismatch repair protein MutS [Lachnospiraceae bacterium]|nr:DNA mismatch repair protein MutS [Lachnospiraceae bacterium]
MQTNLKCKYFKEIYDSIDLMEDVHELLEKAINPDAPITVKDGDIIKPDFNPELKELYDISFNSKEILVELEKKEKEETDIKNLKLGYNKVFGYYLEVTKSYYDKVPYRYIRKQTLANCERYITNELKEIENKLLGANDKRVKLEYAIFEQIRNTLIEQIGRFQKVSDYIGAIDCINALGIVAKDNGYTRPKMTTNGELRIEKGRHPIVAVAVKDSFVANDTYLNTTNESFAIITGPNMSGKSTYMRQIALITIMAHMGSFVPADYASISITSKIFTRIGALDNLSQGKSTFMVEMSELADIIANADKNSLIILDEIGRGTSTIDGVSIALAAVHYITSRIGAKTLFATHYHQLSDLESKIDGVVNYKVAVSEQGEEVVFLHSIKRGGTDKSFGIYVAKLAGLPSDFISMAQNIMNSQGEDFNPDYDSSKIMISSKKDLYKEKYDEISYVLNSIDINNITPMEAMGLISQLQSKIKE